MKISFIKSSRGVVCGNAFKVMAWIGIGVWMGLGAMYGDGGSQEELPADGVAILKAVKQSQMSLKVHLTGKLRSESRVIPFTMKVEEGVTRFEFGNAKGKEPAVVVLKAGAQDVMLEVRDANGALMPVKFQDELFGMGLTYDRSILQHV